jgi:hypothetical protein
MENNSSQPVIRTLFAILILGYKGNQDFSSFSKSMKNQKSFYLIVCNKLFCSILIYFDIFDKSIIFLNGRNTLKADI